MLLSTLSIQLVRINPVQVEKQTILAVVASMTGAKDFSGVDLSSAVAKYQALSAEARKQYDELLPEVAKAFQGYYVSFLLGPINHGFAINKRNNLLTSYTKKKRFQTSSPEQPRRRPRRLWCSLTCPRSSKVC